MFYYRVRDTVETIMKAEEIKALRTRLKLTQAQLAERLKVNEITIARCERGERRPSKVVRRRLAREGVKCQ